VEQRVNIMAVFDMMGAQLLLEKYVTHSLPISMKSKLYSYKYASLWYSKYSGFI